MAKTSVKKIKKQNYVHKVTFEFTAPKNKTVFIRANYSAENKELSFEGQLKLVGEKLKNELPKGYHTDYREDTNKFYWYYLGRQGGGKDFNPKKYFTNHENAVKDAIKYHHQKINNERNK